MESLTFSDIAKLVNHSGITHIDTEPAHSRPSQWALHRGENIVPGFRYPFDLLYVFSDCTQESLQAAAKILSRPTNTQVVMALSLFQKWKLNDETRKNEIRRLLKEPKDIFSTRDYLFNFLRDRLEGYRARVAQRVPEFFVLPQIDVPIGSRRKVPNPLEGFLKDDDTMGGRLAVLLAEPGQGKTYMTRHLASRIKDPIPIFVASDQWFRIGPDEAVDLAKTVAHSFSYFESPIAWISGAEDEFIRVTMKAGLFCLVFDGFDEYVLWNRGRVDAGESIRALKLLAENSGASVLVTSRTSFWHTEIEDTGAISQDECSVYTLVPFDRNHAANYFAERFGGDEDQLRRALEIYDALRAPAGSDAGNFVGRGFIIHLIADLVERTDQNPSVTRGQAVVEWVIEALCQREVVRQKLPLTAEQQLGMFQFFAEQVAAGEEPTSDLIGFAAKCSAGQLSETQVAELTTKLRDHPLIRFDQASGRWRIVQEQVTYALLASKLLVDSAKGAGALEEFARRIFPKDKLRTEIANALFDQMLGSLSEDDAGSKLRELIESLFKFGGEQAPTEVPMPEREFGAALAMHMTNRVHREAKLRADRTDALLAYLPGRRSTQLQLSGMLKSFDFRGVRFVQCRFEQAVWLNCVFDETTVFDRCRFSGGRVDNCEALGLAQFLSCVEDADAASVFGEERIRHGRQRYTRDDLRRDIEHVIRRFVPKEGFGVRAVAVTNLRKGTIGSSVNRERIIASLMRHILEEHAISGSREGGVNVREGARKDVFHFAGNGVFTGTLALAYEELCKEIGL